MTTPDVPAERGRDELRERATKLAQGYLNYPQSVMLRDAIVALFDDLLAQREVPTEGISLSAQLSQAAAWMRVWDECQRLGMDTYGAPSTSTGLDIVLDFIRGRAAPQETREPEALRQTIAEAVERLADRLYPYWRSSEGDGSDYLAVANTIDVLAGKLAAARPAPGTREPTQAEIDDACMWYRHDFGLMSDEDAGRLRFTAREWLRAWHKAGARELLGAPAPAEATTCPCGGGPGHGDAWCGDYECPTCGRGPKLEEAIFQAGLERGRAPAPAEGRQVLALDAIRDVLGIDYDEDSAMWYLPAEPAPIECATLDDALRAYAKMAAPASGEPSGAEAQYRISGAAIRDRRVAAGMSLRELAAAVGIGNVEMGEIERGIRLPDANTATAIREAINAASGSGAEAVVREAPWTDVNDGLPGEQGCDSENVLVFLNGHVGIHDMEGRKGGGWGIRIGFYDAERRAFRVHGGIEPFVTHWMPLPQAPTAPEEGESDAE